MLRDDLARPDAFPAPRPERVEVVETHISLVFLGERDVYKVKKSVDLGFLDFSSIEKRKVACEAEVDLNARLAPGVYLGIVPVVHVGAGGLAFGGRGDVVDWAVHMRRLPDAQRADRLLAENALTGELVEAIADRIALFHAAARSDEATLRYGSRAAIERNVVENFDQTRRSLPAYLNPDEAREIEASQLRFLATHGALLGTRAERARVRDGHGDLRLEHVYVDGPDVRVIDCIEFSDRFRFGDVWADVAFLSMDLAWHGRVDLAERLLARYARASGDYDGYAVVDFYEGYRAYVRGKIAAIMADLPDVDPAQRAHAGVEARRYFLLALAAHRAPLMAPQIVCVGGIIASGKSTVADAIAGELGAPVVDADRTRKWMLGVDPQTRLNDSAWTGAYDRAFTDRVYAEVLRRAGVVLASRRPVVLDASFRSPAFLHSARALARERGVPFHFIECRADAAVCRARLVVRERQGGVSDGRLAIFDDFVKSFEPVSGLPTGEHVVVDTARELEATLADVRAHVRVWPRALVT